jgi:hypothetical protein
VSLFRSLMGSSRRSASAFVTPRYASRSITTSDHPATIEGVAVPLTQTVPVGKPSAAADLTDTVTEHRIGRVGRPAMPDWRHRVHDLGLWGRVPGLSCTVSVAGAL